jgi:hypothetical protein
MQIFVRDLVYRNRTITLDVKPDEPIISVMDKICQKVAVPLPYLQKLVYAGKRLDNHRSRTLNDYRIHKESTIQLVMRMSSYTPPITARERDILSRWQEAERRSLSRLKPEAESCSPAEVEEKANDDPDADNYTGTK